MHEFAARLGLKVPLIQAPMTGVQDWRLAVAASAAGALGSLPAAMLTAEGLRKEVGEARRVSSAPLNLNFFCHASPRVDAERDIAWRAALLPYYRELGIDPDAEYLSAQRAPFDDAMADAVDELAPAVVSFHFGLPTARLLSRVKASGALIFACATTLDEATWLAEQSVDAVIAQGLQAGGHRGNFLRDDLAGQVGTLDLIDQIITAINLPVIAAGGIGDADSVALALQRGAAAVQVGSAYLLCPEARTSLVHRAAVADRHRLTAITNVFSGRPARGVINRLMRERGPISNLVPQFPLAASASAALRAAAEAREKDDFSPLWCGEVAPIHSNISTAEVTRLLCAKID